MLSASLNTYTMSL